MAEGEGPGPKTGCIINKASEADSGKGPISFLGAVSIGVGGMIGAGVFAILGVVASASGSAMWLSFVIGAVVALFATYSYAKLGGRFPSSGGPVEFLVHGYGDNVFTGGVNIFMWIAYVIAITLYAKGFAAYFMTFFTSSPTSIETKVAAIGIVVLFTIINFLGAKIVGRSETYIVVIKVVILVFFAVTGLFFAKGTQLSPAGWPGVQDILFGAGILFIGYEGFGLVTNAAGSMENPSRTLPRALFTSVFIVMAIYILVAITVTGNLTPSQIAASRDHALAQAAKPFLGTFGFKLLAVAALFSTASAINATLFGAANVSFAAAKDGELPRVFSRHEWNGGSGGLLITAGLVVLFTLLFDLSGISMMGSAAFLLIYSAVNVGHLRIISQTGARRWVVWVSLILCLLMFCLLSIYIFQNSKAALIALAITLIASFTGEWVFRRITARRIKAQTA